MQARLPASDLERSKDQGLVVTVEIYGDWLTTWRRESSVYAKEIFISLPCQSLAGSYSLSE